MIYVIIAIVAIACWNWGYWVGRIQRPDTTWDWRPTAIDQGWVHKLHITDPTHHDEYGRYKFWGE